MNKIVSLQNSHARTSVLTPSTIECDYTEVRGHTDAFKGVISLDTVIQMHFNLG